MHANEMTESAHGDVTACVVPPAGTRQPALPDVGSAGDVPDDDLDPELLDPDDLDIDDLPCVDDAHWDVFIPDEDERDPLPEPGDFWMEESGENDEARITKHE